MMDVQTLLLVFALLLIIGAFAGMLAGLLGVGGGLILVPAFYFSFSYLGYKNEQLMQICVATALATMIVTSIFSVRTHHARNSVDWEIFKTWAPSIAVGGILGMFMATYLHSNHLAIVFGFFGIIVGLYMAFGQNNWQLKDKMPVGFLRISWSILIGFFSVLMGIGGGSISVPMMTVHGISMHRAVGTSASFGLIIALSGTTGFLLSAPPSLSAPPFMLGYVNIPALIVVISMTFLTTPYGANLAHRLNVNTLRVIFSFVLIMIAGKMLLEGLFY